MLAQCLYAIAFGRMVPGRNEGHAGLTRHMHILLGNLTGQECIHPQRHRLLEIVLRRTAAPGDAPDCTPFFPDDLRRALQCMFDMHSELLQRKWPLRHTMTGNILFTEATLLHQDQSFCQLRIVAQFGMRIQRQVIRQQADIVLQQVSEPALLDAGNRLIFIAPEVAVMHQDRIRPPGRSRLQYMLRCADPGGNTTDLGTPLHLHSVGAVVTKPAYLQQASDIITHLV